MHEDPRMKVFSHLTSLIRDRIAQICTGATAYNLGSLHALFLCNNKPQPVLNIGLTWNLEHPAP